MFLKCHKTVVFAETDPQGGFPPTLLAALALAPASSTVFFSKKIFNYVLFFFSTNQPIKPTSFAIDMLDDCSVLFSSVVTIACFPISNKIELSLDFILQVVCQSHVLLDNDVHESLRCCVIATVRLPTLWPLANLN